MKEHNNLNDFELGWFIHLITDYLFFKECFREEYLKSISYETFYKDLYDAYECLNNYITEKYQITMDDYKAYPGEYYPGKEYHECILTKEEIDHFINEVSSIDIDKYIKLIKKEKKNISFQ